eukprot:Hpha_TRINITY_DN31506_c0_g1::TRINITY_DN31506_c0_g1_i1::g.1759::m.1759
MLVSCVAAVLSAPPAGWYAIGGENEQSRSRTTLDSVEFIASTGGAAWMRKAALPKPLRFHAGAFFPPSSIGALYVLGGVDGSGEPQSAVYKMDAHSWATATAMTGTRLGHAVVATAEYLYVLGGASTLDPPISRLNTVERLSLATGQWEAGGDGWGAMGAKRLHLGGAYSAVDSGGGRVFAIGGENELGSALDTAEYLDASFSSNGWKGTPKMTVARIKAAVAGTNDRVWVCSGSSDATVVVIESTCEWLDAYDPWMGWQSLAAPADWDPLHDTKGALMAGM